MFSPYFPAHNSISNPPIISLLRHEPPHKPSSRTPPQAPSAGMAIRRVFGRLWTFARAAAATRARAPPVGRETFRRLVSRFQVDGMAAASARGQKAHACAVARLEGFRAEGEKVSGAIVAFAEARALATRAYYLSSMRQAGAAAAFAGLRMRQAGAAAAFAGLRMRQASDRTIATVLWIAYGESAPIVKTPSLTFLLELYVEEGPKILFRIWRLTNLLEGLMEPETYWVTIALGMLLGPVLSVVAEFVSIAPTPEYICPFLGVSGLDLDLEEFSAKEGLLAVSYLAARSGCVIVMCFGGLGICLVLDLSEACSAVMKAMIGQKLQGSPPEIMKLLHTGNLSMDAVNEEEDCSLRMCPTKRKEPTAMHHSSLIRSIFVRCMEAVNGEECSLRMPHQKEGSTAVHPSSEAP